MRRQAINKKYHVTLDEDARATLHDLLASGKAAARTLTHVRILLKADESADGPGWTDEAVCEALDVGLATIGRVRQRFVEEGLEAALHRHAPTRDYHHLVDGEAEAHLIALACSTPPEGHGHWTLHMLADRMVKLEYIDSISHETVRQVLKKTNSSRG